MYFPPMARRGQHTEGRGPTTTAWVEKGVSKGKRDRPPKRRVKERMLDTHSQ